MSLSDAVACMWRVKFWESTFANYDFQRSQLKDETEISCLPWVQSVEIVTSANERRVDLYVLPNSPKYVFGGNFYSVFVRAAQYTPNTLNIIGGLDSVAANGLEITAIVGGQSFLFRPLEYWPYDPGDGGGPIYDSNTGAQLRSFPT